MEERRHIVRNITLNDRYNIKEAIARAQADARIADAITNRSEDATIPSAIARARHDQHQEAQRQVQIKHDVLVQKLYRWWARDPWGYVDADLLKQMLIEAESTEFWEKQPARIIRVRGFTQRSPFKSVVEVCTEP